MGSIPAATTNLQGCGENINVGLCSSSDVQDTGYEVHFVGANPTIPANLCASVVERLNFCLQNSYMQVRVLSGAPFTAIIAQLARARDCDFRGYGFKSRWSPHSF